MKESFVKFQNGMVSIGRLTDKSVLQITFPTINFKHCKFSKRKDYYILAPTTVRFMWGPNEICVGISVLGFGIGFSFEKQLDK